MKRLIVIMTVAAALSGCQKLGMSGLNRVIGDWAQVHPPAGCKPKQIAAEQEQGVAVLCEDGRIFH